MSGAAAAEQRVAVDRHRPLVSALGVRRGVHLDQEPRPVPVGGEVVMDARPQLLEALPRRRVGMYRAGGGQPQLALDGQVGGVEQAD